MKLKRKVLSCVLNLSFNIKLKKDLKAFKKDLGSFCAQYGITMPIPPSQMLKKQKPYKETPYKKFKKFKKDTKKFKSQKSNEQK